MYRGIRTRILHLYSTLQVGLPTLHARALQIRIRIHKHPMREYVRLALPDGKPARAFHTGCPRTTVLHLKGREEIRANGEWRRAARERG